MAQSGDVEVDRVSEAGGKTVITQVTVVPSAISVQTIAGVHAWITYQG